MTASIEVSPEYNLEKIATLAGNARVEGRLYRDGRLYVDGVTQEALDAALAAYDHAAETAKRDAVAQIAALEAQVTQRRLREAVLTTEGSDWLETIESEIATLRSTL